MDFLKVVFHHLYNRKTLVLVAFAILLSACQFQGEATPTATAIPTATPIPTPIVASLAGSHIIFNDEFDGDGLKRNKWTDEYLWGRTNPPELQYYAPNALVVNHGILSIKAENTPTQGMAYSSGVITSFKSFQFTYGYVEARIRIPSGQGLWPALWLLDVEGSADEIDIVEFLGHQPDVAYMTLHYPDQGGNNQETKDGHYHGPDFSAEYHIVSVDWNPSAIIWYIDGVERYRHTHDIPDAPMYLLANLAVGGDWPGSPDDTTHFPASYNIDYIRVFQK